MHEIRSNHERTQWTVEDTSAKPSLTGAKCLTMFVGIDCEQRAKEYAAWMNSRKRSPLDSADKQLLNAHEDFETVKR